MIAVNVWCREYRVIWPTDNDYISAIADDHAHLGYEQLGLLIGHTCADTIIFGLARARRYYVPSEIAARTE